MWVLDYNDIPDYFLVENQLGLINCFYLQVQECYGRSYVITILGYLITKSAVMGIVSFDEDISHLTLRIKSDCEDSISENLSAIIVNESINEYKSTIPWPSDLDASEKAIAFDDSQSEAANLRNCKLIHVAQNLEKSFDIRSIENEYFETLESLSDDIEYSQLEDINVCRLPDEKWLVELSKKIPVKTLFTALYV